MICLFCQSSNLINAIIPRPTIFNNKIFSYFQCKDCKLVFIDPIPCHSDYEKMYSASYHDTFYFREVSPDYSDVIELVNQYRTNGTMLDYGCGDGGFLNFFSKHDFICSGAEFTPELVRNLKTMNPKMTFFTITDFWEQQNSPSYNFIHLGDVLEHLETPLLFINKIKKRLQRNNGVLIVRGPLENNSSLAFMCRYFTSWLSSKLNPNKTFKHVPYHITFSNSKNQSDFFEKCGLEQLYFKVFETPWPYPLTFEGGMGNKLKYLIGQVSMLLAKISPLKHGNRFIYLGRLKQ